jgi:hypothetical protein
MTNEWIEKYLKVVDAIIAVVHYKRMAVWKGFFFNPAKTISNNVDSISARVIDLYVMEIIGIAIVLVGMFPGLILGGLASAILAPLVIGIFAFILIISPLLNVVYAFIEHRVARALGGVADFKTHFNASTLSSLAAFTINLPLVIANIPFIWLSYVPYVSLCVGIITLPIRIATALVGIYAIYIKYLALREVHKLSSLRIIGVILIPMAIVFVLLLMVFLAFYALIIGGLVGGLLTKSLLR